MPLRRRRSLRVLSLLAAAPLLSGALVTSSVQASPLAPRRVEATEVPATYHGRVAGEGLVVEGQDGAPYLCMGVFQSLPPQCSGGLRLVGFSWTGVAHEERAGSRWGEARVVGHVEGAGRTQLLLLTQPATTAPPVVAGPRVDRFTAPCPVPAGGWRPVHQATTTRQGRDALLTLASADPRSAGAWIDSRSDTGPVVNGRRTHSYVLVAAFTDAPAKHRAALRAVWGGALCIVQMAHTERELVQAQNALIPARYGSSGIDIVRNHVTQYAWFATREDVDSLTRRFGDRVQLVNHLQPVDPLR